jgi:hypothetical protein
MVLRVMLFRAWCSVRARGPDAVVIAATIKWQPLCYFHTTYKSPRLTCVVKCIVSANCLFGGSADVRIIISAFIKLVDELGGKS